MSEELFLHEEKELASAESVLALSGINAEIDRYQEALNDIDSEIDKTHIALKENIGESELEDRLKKLKEQRSAVHQQIVEYKELFEDTGETSLQLLDEDTATRH